MKVLKFVLALYVGMFKFVLEYCRIAYIQVRRRYYKVDEFVSALCIVLFFAGVVFFVFSNHR